MPSSHRRNSIYRDTGLAKKADNGGWNQMEILAIGNHIRLAVNGKLVADWKDEGLEIGPGTARFTIPLLRQGMKMTVCDISPGMLEMARTNITGAGFGKSVRASQFPGELDKRLGHISPAGPRAHPVDDDSGQGRSFRGQPFE